MIQYLINLDRFFTRFCLSFIFGALIVLGFGSHVFAQGQNKMLWQISGNGLAKPSYLFGSMHVKNAAAFHFTDSVYIALAASESFSMEIDPDSMMRDLFAYLDGSKKMPDLIMPKAASQEKIKERYKQMFGVDADSSLLQNPMVLYGLSMPDISDETDEDQIVDLHLYGLAKTLGKPHHPLEPTESQFTLLFEMGKEMEELVNADEELYKEKVTEMTALYAEGDLDGIYAYIKNYLDTNQSMIQRNITMSQQLLRLMPRQSTFAVAGAAHLPGPQGLIALLRKSGYTVRAVGASFTGIAKDYSIDYDRMLWQDVHEDVQRFNASFPPGYVYRKENPYVLTMSYVDLLRDGELSIHSSLISSKMAQQGDAYLSQLLDSLLHEESTTLLYRKPLNKGRFSGLGYEIRQRDKLIRAEMWIAEGRLHILRHSRHEKRKDNSASDRFCQSFHIVDNPGQSAMKLHKNEVGAFEVLMPGTAQLTINEVPQPDNPDGHPYKIYMHTAADTEHFITYLTRYNDYPVGVSLVSKEQAYSNTIAQFTARGTLIGEPSIRQYEQHERRYFQAVIDHAWIDVEMFFRGNRFYLLMREHIGDDRPLEGTDFYDSFRFLPFKQVENTAHQVAGLSLSMPSAPLLLATEEGKADPMYKTLNSYAAKDPNTGASLSILHVKLDDYYRNQRGDTLFYGMYQNIKDEQDSLQSYSREKLQDNWAATYRSSNSAQQLEHIWTVCAVDDNLYAISVAGGAEALNNKSVADFIASFKRAIPQPSTPLTVFDSKAAIVLKDLQSNDSTVHKKALVAVRDHYEFDRDDLPLLHRAIAQRHADDAGIGGSRVVLMNEFKNLHDASTASILKKVYTQKGTTDALRSSILSIIVDIDPSQFDWYFNTLVSTRPRSDNTRAVTAPLRDSVDYALLHFDRLSPLFQDIEYRKTILSLANYTAESDSTLQVLRLNRPWLLQHATTDLTHFVEHVDDPNDPYYLATYSYLKFFGLMQEKELLSTFSTTILSLDSLPYLKTQLLLGQLAAGLPIDKTLFAQQLENAGTRYDVMSALAKFDLLDWVPQRYKEADVFAKMLFNEYVYTEYGYPDTLQQLGIIKHAEASYYVFSFTFDDDESSYIGIVGPFQNGDVPIAFELDACYSDFTEADLDNWQGYAEALIEEIQP